METRKKILIIGEECIAAAEIRKEIENAAEGKYEIEAVPEPYMDVEILSKISPDVAVLLVRDPGHGYRMAVEIMGIREYSPIIAVFIGDMLDVETAIKFLKSGIWELVEYPGISGISRPDFADLLTRALAARESSLLEEEKNCHAHKMLWDAVVKLTNDYFPYGGRHRAEDDRCCSDACRFFLRLEGDSLHSWGVCANDESPRCGLLTYERMGCTKFELGD